MPTLRSKVIRLAYWNPGLRPHLLPLVRTATDPEEEAAIILWETHFEKKYHDLLDGWLDRHEAVIGPDTRKWVKILRNIPQEAAYHYPMMMDDLDFRANKLLSALAKEKVDRQSGVNLLRDVDGLFDKFRWRLMEQ